MPPTPTPLTVRPCSRKGGGKSRFRRRGAPAVLSRGAVEPGRLTGGDGRRGRQHPERVPIPGEGVLPEERADVQQQPDPEDPVREHGDAAVPRRRHGRLHLLAVQREPKARAAVGEELRALLPGRDESVRRAVPSPGGGSWCVANAAVGRERMQAALDWACGQGGADCGPIQPGAPCYEPNTVEAHASYAMNSYYQRHSRDASACNFNGVGQIVYQRPSFVNCESARDSWCVANPAVGQGRMQAALDWACGQGRADCGPIQPGAPCYEPNTVEAHASYAMNSYYQSAGRTATACDFGGAGRIVDQRPRYGNCDFPSSKR